MKKFRNFAFFTTIATYFLIFIGGLVRVSGAGLGCPDWPKCFDSWIPPTSIDQVPPEMVGQFNMTLAWIEYINRLSGMTVGLFILATAIWAIAKYRDHKKIYIPASAAAVLTALQGYQGSVVVSSLLEPVIITVHMLLAILIVSLLIYTTAQAYYLENQVSVIYGKIPKSISKQVGVLYIVSLIQLLLGTQIRSSIEHITREFPNLESGEWLGKVGMINHIHMGLGILLVLFAWIVGFSILKYKEQFSGFIRASALIAMLVITIQLILGMIFITFDLVPIAQVAHMWMASIFVGLVLLLYVTAKELQE